MIIPTHFLKISKEDIVIASVCLPTNLSACPTVCYAISSAIVRNQIQPNLVCELLTWMGRATAHFYLAHWGPVAGLKGQISLNFNYKVNFDYFHSKLCVRSHKQYIWNISSGIFIKSPRFFHSGGTWGCLPVENIFFQHDLVAYQIEGDGE